ncbi:MAG: molybdopterin-dependent oxidoreductase [Candidatus Methanomethyliaceae archaeon]|nr:molybdopterin-dependent oxidoreductase [Candidatus Methanomethyliaceae archaeon]
MVERRFFSTCPKDCYDTCVMYSYVGDEGTILKVEGRRDHGFTRGFLCNKGQKILDWAFSPERLKYPMKRSGPKGSGVFKRISWDEAFDTIVQKLKEVMKEFGSLSVLPYDYAGHMGLLSRYYPYRFFNKIGASQLEYTICSETGKRALNYHYGTFAGMDPEDILNSKYVVIWGFNPAWTSVHFFGLIKKSGSKVVVIDPIKSETAEHADLYIQPRPGTDSALALGIANYLITNNLYDREFVEKFTHGFDNFKEVVRKYTPEKVSAICGIDKDTFTSFSEEYGRTKPAAVLIGLGIQRNVNGGEIVRSISLLPALTGNIGRCGGGFFYSNSAYFTIDYDMLKGNKTGEIRRKINMIKLGEALLDKNLNPPIKFLFVYNSNPAAVCPDLNKVRKGLSREDLFTVVHDLFMTDTADFADIVLPATSHFETFDVHFTYCGLYVSVNEKAIEPIGESKSNFEVFTELARRMGYSDIIEEPEVLADKVLRSGTGFMQGITLKSLREKGFLRLNTPNVPHVAFCDFRFNTPSGKIEFYSKAAEADGLPPIPDYTEVHRGYPLRFITPFHRDTLKSQYFNIRSIYSEEGMVVEMNMEDAKARGIKDGDIVKVYNNRGECVMRVKISSRVGRGVVLSYGIPWPKLVGGGTPNFTTSSTVSDMGDGSTYHTNYVEVEKV